MKKHIRVSLVFVAIRIMNFFFPNERIRMSKFQELLHGPEQTDVEPSQGLSQTSEHQKFKISSSPKGEKKKR